MIWAPSIKSTKQTDPVLALIKTYHIIDSAKSVARCNSRIKLDMKCVTRDPLKDGHKCQICQNVAARLEARAVSV